MSLRRAAPNVSFRLYVPTRVHLTQSSMLSSSCVGSSSFSEINDSRTYPDFHRTAVYSFHNPNKLIDQYRQAFESIDGNAKLTEFGGRLLEDSRDFAEA